MDLCDGTLALLQHAVGDIIQRANVKQFDTRHFYSTMGKKKKHNPVARRPRLFPYVARRI